MGDTNKVYQKWIHWGKAFELTERDFSKVLQKEKFEKSLIEGLATSYYARSLITEY